MLHCVDLIISHCRFYFNSKTFFVVLDTHSCKELHLKSHVYALQNFQQVVGTEEFLLLPFEEVNELISNSQLNISSEEDVFTSVLNWVKHDLAERSKYISRVSNIHKFRHIY